VITFTPSWIPYGNTIGDNVYSFVDTLLPTTDVSEIVRAGGVMLKGRILTVEARGEAVDVRLYGRDGRMEKVFTGIVFGRKDFHLKDVKGKRQRTTSTTSYPSVRWTL